MNNEMLINGKKIEKVLVLGLGISGLAALKLAEKKGFSVVGIDESDHFDMIKLTAGLKDSIHIITGFTEPILPESDLIIISPGIPNESHLGRLASESGTPVISELDFGAGFARIPILAVTGTNGKTTVTEMTEMLIDHSIACGNIGYPLSEAVLDRNADFLVVECSSFQLERAPSFSPVAATLLNVTSDHMDRYANFAEYLSAKFAVFNKVSDAHNMIINYDLICEWNKRKDKFYSIKPEERPWTFSATSKLADIKFIDGVVDFGKLGIGRFSLNNSDIKGKHNIENFMAATALAASVLPEKKLVKSAGRLIHDFKLSPHRQEIIAEKDGVLFVNDSKATNPDAVKAALDLFSEGRNICLIAGGLDKQMDFSSILEYRHNIKIVFLIGENRKKLYDIWHDDIECVICRSLEDAVMKSTKKASKSDVVLLSPGCASMDMFVNYKERGDFFRKIIMQSLA